MFVVAAPGCSRETGDRSPTTGALPADAEASVRKRFAELQAAVKAQDADKLWGMLASKSRASAEQLARGIRTAYEKAGPGERAEQEKALGLAGEELAKLTGVGFLKTRRFRRKYDEVADGTVTRVTVQGDSATVYFSEPDGDREKLVFLREDGRWQAWIVMPRGDKP
jgi:hypothetical protein